MDYQVTETIIKYKEMEFPETLYKYRDWDAAFNKTILTKREVYFASPTSFVDPFDCKNSSRWDLLSYVDLLQKYFEQSLRIKKLTLFDRVEWAVNWANDSPVTDAKFVKEQQERDFLAYNERVGVLSLTECNKLIPMWNMYSDNHKGFCIGFDPKIMLEGINAGGGKVIYYDELPIIYPTPKHNFSMQAFLQVFSKLKKWKFENEYRVYKFKYDPLTINDRAQVISPEAYKELIFGAEMSKKTIETIIESLPQELNHLKNNLKIASIIDNKIKILDYHIQ